MSFALFGKIIDVTGQLKEMEEMSERGGGIIYRGVRAADGTVCVVRTIIPAGTPDIPAYHIRIENLDPSPSQALYNHSPDGFEWGYSGSVPTQLALALVLDATGDKVLALKYHQEFKERFVAGWGASWSIHSEQVRAWVELKRRHEQMKEAEENAGNN